MVYEKKISICMMIKDEEKNLDRCLKSLVPIVESGLAELIIVDTGSQDNSIKIAKKYTDRVYEHPWTNNFSEMRNVSISYAKGEWVWIIDADEEIEDPQEVLEFLKQDFSQYNTIGMRVKNYMESLKSEKEPAYNISISVRIFRNTQDFKYEGSIHNQPIFKKPVLESNIILKHYGYIWEDEEFKKKKFERTAGLLRKELEKNPNDIYYQYQLAVSTNIIDKVQGLEESRKAYELVNKVPYKNRYRYIYVYGNYTISAFNNGEYKETIKICQEGLALNQDYIDLWFTLFTAYAQTNDDDNILKSGKEFLECKKRFDKSPVSKDPSLTFYYLSDSWEEKVLYSVALIYIKKKEYDVALEYIRKIQTVDLKSKAMAKFATEEDKSHLVIDYLKEIKEDEDKIKFIDALEKQNVKEEVRKLIRYNIMKFYEDNGQKEEPYYLLSIIRDKVEREEFIDQDMLQKIANFNYDELKDYYGDIIICIIRQGLELSLFESIGDTSNVDRFTKYAMGKYKDFYKEINEYLHKYDNVEEIHLSRYWVTLAKNLLIREKLSDHDYMELFQKYITQGFKYINNIYDSYILKENMIYDIYNREHKFFIFMKKAYQVKESNIKEYIRYLRQALKVYPMKKGVSLLLEQVKEDIDAKEDENQIISKEKQSEFEEYKIIVKNNINLLIEAKKITEVKLLIDEYLQIVPNDLEMLNLKSEIQLKFM